MNEWLSVTFYVNEYEVLTSKWIVLQLLQLLTTQQSETGCFRSADCGERDIMSQETIDRVLTIERQASGEFVSAQQQAARIVQDAKAEASNEYHEALRIAKERAKEIEQAKQETADAEHQRIRLQDGRESKAACR